MPITKKSGRQEVIAATVEFSFADLVSGAYAAAVDVPGGAIVDSGYCAILTIFNSGTDDKFSIGDKVGSASATATTYAAQSADITAPGIIQIVPTGKKYAEPSTIGIVWTGSGAAPTAGTGRLTVKYIVDGRAAFTQG
ncbi:MAG: hypothetical protein ABS37_00350 [Acidovorax sp. SCN 65-108]|nr:MAG: hypothetical protein ABS37_00350 [Acidovorax sp. SCN 65-108]OJV73519.1 MAG: hypothetical protein BGO35_13090 [Burkholderiales bacterium 64-34]